MAIDPDALPKPKKRSPWRVASPLIFFLVLAGGWSGFWVFMSGQVEAGIDEALAQEARHGNTIACADRKMGGFPFRFELRCRALSVDVDRGEERWSLSAAHLLAVAQAYSPRHVIIQVTGPVTVTSPDDPREIEANFADARASFVAGDKGPDRVALVLGGLNADLLDGETRKSLIGNATVEFHARRSEAPDAADGSYDVALQVDAETVPDVDTKLGPAPAKIDVRGVVKGLTDWEPQSLKTRLRNWQAAGGSVHVERVQIDRGDTSAKASGDVALDAEGHPDGKLFLTLAGVEALAQKLKEGGLAPPNLTNMLGLGLNILGKPSNIDGKAAVELPLTLKQGKASLGAFPIASIEPLF